MLLHFHWVLRLWEESSQDSSTGTLPFQLRNLRFSQLLLIIKLKSVSQFFRVREKWLLIIKNSEILSLVESQWLPEDIHRSKSLLILTPMVFWTYLLRTKVLVKLNLWLSDQVVVSVMPRLSRWLLMLKLQRKQIKREERSLTLRMMQIIPSTMLNSNWENMVTRSLKMLKIKSTVMFHHSTKQSLLKIQRKLKKP